MNDTVRSTLEHALQTLESERDRVVQQIAILQGIVGGNGQQPKKALAPTRGAESDVRRPMSARARKHLSRKLKAYWAKRRGKKVRSR